MKKNELIKIFLIAFGVFAAAIIPQLIFTGGVWIYYGDFNVQQIPFYMHVHESVRAGRFLYDWSTDLGGSFIGCYSFYLYGSPFFWLTIPFPTAMVPYLMPWLAALKYAVMALGAYIYARKHLKTEIGAFTAAMLFAFSGFQGAVLVYNHFHDFVCFFPFWLYLFERLVEEKKKLGFIFMTALMIIINYYFFVGGAVYLVIHFIVRYVVFEKDRRRLVANFFRTFLSALSGVLISGLFLVPGIYYTMGNSRLTDTLNGYDLLAYKDSVMWLSIVKNLIMLPDVSGLNSMLTPDMARVSGIGAYIPMFSLAGVIAYFITHKGKNWQKIVMVTLAVFAGIPMLNGLFSALNSEYYARWFYIPVLIMALMTGEMVEQRADTVKPMKRGAAFVGIATITLIAMSLLPAKTDEGTYTVLGKLKNPEQLCSEIVFSTVMFVFLVVYLIVLYKKNDGIMKLVISGACFLTAFIMLTTGAFLVETERKSSFINQVIKGESPLKNETDEFYRVETDEDMYNYPMFWEAHSITSFISTIPDSTLEAYHTFDIPRKVTSNPYTTRIGFRALTSAKYYIKDDEIAIETIGRLEDPSDLRDYREYRITDNGYIIYENENFIPMGFTFDDYVTLSEFKDSSLSSQQKDKLLVKTLILEDKDAEVYGRLMNHFDMENDSAGSFSNNCDARRDTACTEFEVNHLGFRAHVDMKRNNLLFFSVPFEKGFGAYVDGQKKNILKVDAGFMAVYVPEGEHEIEFRFFPSNMGIGLIVTCLGFVICFVLVLIDTLILRNSVSHDKTRGGFSGKKKSV